MKNYYEILGVSSNAEKEVIIGAYKALAKKYHPDIFGASGHEKMREINEAYSILSNELLRMNYNKEFKIHYEEHYQDINSNKEFDVIDNLEEKWKLILDFHPELNKYDLLLKGYSNSLSAAFKTKIISEKKFNECNRTAINLLKSFSVEYLNNISTKHGLKLDSYRKDSIQNFTFLNLLKCLYILKNYDLIDRIFFTLQTIGASFFEENYFFKVIDVSLFLSLKKNLHYWEINNNPKNIDNILNQLRIDFYMTSKYEMGCYCIKINGSFKDFSFPNAVEYVKEITSRARLILIEEQIFLDDFC